MPRKPFRVYAGRAASATPPAPKRQKSRFGPYRVGPRQTGKPRVRALPCAPRRSGGFAMPEIPRQRYPPGAKKTKNRSETPASWPHSGAEAVQLPGAPKDTPGAEKSHRVPGGPCALCGVSRGCPAPPGPQGIPPERESLTAAPRRPVCALRCGRVPVPLPGKQGIGKGRDSYTSRPGPVPVS